MDDCIFCKIGRGEIPADKVYEDENFMAFMDSTPRSPGHVQVIPKKHYRWVWDVPNAGSYFEVARKIAQAQQKAFGVEKIYGNIAGDDVAHAHIWVFPNPPATSGDKMDIAGNAIKIREALK
ncbi:MAG: HIT domain-containing protein [Patescibacteria group bacterium]|nr:HIT domain-containing protein [Patescibacteria group bacterium]